METFAIKLTMEEIQLIRTSLTSLKLKTEIDKQTLQTEGGKRKANERIRSCKSLGSKIESELVEIIYK
jgi:hypothetical protein